ncbi:unnamed protein product [Adineta steineri]|uniref:Uncharacterized protein n=1 Tax=Adineta steineri TaxID=433720 RepID=A0A816E4B0_9BILA|nr:unnamed protein product [Adineta steineri]CAF1645031.1 unnamed protein product [Adineta steineri]
MTIRSFSHESINGDHFSLFRIGRGIILNNLKKDQQRCEEELNKARNNLMACSAIEQPIVWNTLFDNVTTKAVKLACVTAELKYLEDYSIMVISMLNQQGQSFSKDTRLLGNSPLNSAQLKQAYTNSDQHQLSNYVKF